MVQMSLWELTLIVLKESCDFGLVGNKSKRWIKSQQLAFTKFHLLLDPGKRVHARHLVHTCPGILVFVLNFGFLYKRWKMLYIVLFTSQNSKVSRIQHTKYTSYTCRRSRFLRLFFFGLKSMLVVRFEKGPMRPEGTIASIDFDF